MTRREAGHMAGEEGRKPNHTRHPSVAPSLARKLGVFPATNLVIANMIGAGIFTTSGLLMQELGNPLLMIGLWAGGGVLALCGALCYGELGAAMPRAGGEYVYLGELFHPILGFLTGWVSFFVGFSAPLAASSLGCSEYLAEAFPELVGWGNPDLLKKALAIVVIAALGAVHLRGIEFGARIQNWLTVGKVLLIVGLVVVGFAVGQGSLSHFAVDPVTPAPSDPAQLTDSFSPASPGGLKAIALSLMWIMFAYTGWNASAYIGSEIENPGRSLPLSLLIGTSIVLLLYLSLNVLFVFAIPPGEMHGVIAVGALAASRLFGGAMETTVSTLIAFALLSSISAIILLGPRVYYAMARGGYFFRFVGDVHPLSRVPSKSILLQCAIAAIMVMSGTFDQILTYMGFCLGIFPIVAVLGVFKLRRSGAGKYRMPGYPIPPVVFSVVSVLMLVLAYFERPVESSVALATVGLGLPFYFLFRKASSR
ncbi:APC family permease [Gemmatimonadota bacterium]